MPKYYDLITLATSLNQKSGSAYSAPPDFAVFCSEIISKCNFLQNLIQQIIFISHENELSVANAHLRKFKNPKARMDFLLSFPYTKEDPVVSKIFEFSRNMFFEIYKLRNILAHEVWSCSDDYPGSNLFHDLDEHLRMLVVSGKMWHKTEVKPPEIFDAIVRFIRSVKLITAQHLRLAICDIDLCTWSLMNIMNIISAETDERREAARKAFFVFRGTSHLFDEAILTTEPVEYSNSRTQEIR